jgi:hypothetical protein
MCNITSVQESQVYFRSSFVMLRKIPTPTPAQYTGVWMQSDNNHSLPHARYASMPVREPSLRFSYSHLLFSETLALPVDGVGVPGVALDELSPNRLLPMGLPP